MFFEIVVTVSGAFLLLSRYGKRYPPIIVQGDFGLYVRGGFMEKKYIK
jgi:hypothetical protein